MKLIKIRIGNTSHVLIQGMTHEGRIRDTVEQSGDIVGRSGTRRRTQLHISTSPPKGCLYKGFYGA